MRRTPEGNVTLSEAKGLGHGVRFFAALRMTFGAQNDRYDQETSPVTFLEYLLITLLWITSLFLVILVLIQRGRGGGLAGALGGMGGQSAFGAKAGDTFTRITVGVAGAWILICILLFYLYSHSSPEKGLGSGRGGGAGGTPAQSLPAEQE